MNGKPYHHGDLRRQLIDTTRAIVEEEGPDGITLARIAKGCGVSVAAPYRHFSSKEALLGDVAGLGFGELGAAVAASQRTSKRARDRIVDAGVAYVGFATAHPHLFRLMFSAELRDRQSAAGPATLAGLAQVVRGLNLAVPFETALRTTWAIAHGLASLRVGGMLTFTDGDSEQRLREELTALLDGIAA
jgi:AcrR family transcriptional regulator